MWNSTPTTRAVELWSRERGLSRVSAAILLRSTCAKDPHAHWDMIEGLENRYRIEGCSFNTIFIAMAGSGAEASSSRRLLGRCYARSNSLELKKGGESRGNRLS